MKFSVNSSCPCGSKNKYKKCCQPFHKGKLPKTALELMKSRYSAYVVKNIDYIIKTTHKENLDFTIQIKQWKDDVLLFCEESNFIKLEILETNLNDLESFVTFKVELQIKNKDESFVEKSKFLKENNMWLYHSAIVE
ncbi:MAG: SEC-C domain-containing protein [Arcobacteraceae bacterium]|nr:SEC-C domain-containing protein [Arcobacteraceae bacterium]